MLLVITCISYIYIFTLNAHADESSEDRDLNWCLSFNLYTHFVYSSIEDEIVQMHSLD